MRLVRWYLAPSVLKIQTGRLARARKSAMRALSCAPDEAQTDSDPARIVKPNISGIVPDRLDEFRKLRHWMISPVAAIGK
jgi:hypothetical protein